MENRKDNNMWDKEANRPVVSIKNIGHLIMDYGEEKNIFTGGTKKETQLIMTNMAEGR